MTLHVPYTACEIIVAVFATFGNALVILIFCRHRRIRKTTNYYIVSLAVADLLVGMFGIPFAILTSIGIPENFLACKFMLSLLLVLCTASILNLVAVSVDRFWAILYPLSYKRLMHSRTIIVIIIGCWTLGVLIGFLPVMGWNEGKPSHPGCYFVAIMNYDFLLFIYFVTIVLPTLLMAWFYGRIYSVVLKQIKQIAALDPTASGSKKMANGKEINAAKNLFIIVVFFVLCWIPLYTINAVVAFCKPCSQDIPAEVTLFAVILSHTNSAMNPLLYAFYLKDFRFAMRRLFSHNRVQDIDVLYLGTNYKNESFFQTASIQRKNLRQASSANGKPDRSKVFTIANGTAEVPDSK
ncbi:ador-1 (predicted) [Pycnogonum litorale]